MSRLPLFLWLSAVGAAAYPTWDTWSALLGESSFYACGGFGYWPESLWQRLFDPLILPLRADAQALMYPAITWAVPVLVVLWALRHRRSALTGRRAAATLTLLAALDAFSVSYFDPKTCAGLHPFTAEWLVRTGDRFRTTEVALLAAAALVLLATQFNRAEQSPAAPDRSRSSVRRTLTFLIAYWAVALVITLISRREPSLFIDDGLLYRLSSEEFLDVPWPLPAATVIVVYALARRTREDWRRLVRRFWALL